MSDDATMFPAKESPQFVTWPDWPGSWQMLSHAARPMAEVGMDARAFARRRTSRLQSIVDNMKIEEVVRNSELLGTPILPQQAVVPEGM